MTIFFPMGIAQLAELKVSIVRLQVQNKSVKMAHTEKKKKNQNVLLFFI